MGLQSVKIKKFKCLKNVEAEINGANIILIGDNGVGKSSFMQFIQIALGDSKKVPPNASGEGQVVYDREGNKLKIDLHFDKKGKPVITVNGMRNVSKSYIASIVGAMSFDINKFVELSEKAEGRKEQVKIFKSFLPEQVLKDIATYEQSIKSNYEERTATNKNIEELAGFIATHHLKNENLDSFKEFDIKDVLEKQKEANKQNDIIKDVKSRIEKRKEEIVKNNEDIVELEAKIEKIKKDSEEKQIKNSQAEEWLSLNDLADVSIFEAQITQASEQNKKFEQAKILKEKQKLMETCKMESAELTKKIEKEREAVADVIKSMASPVSGLSFDEDTLIYKGVPVNTDSLSTSEIIELGVRLKMAENPDLGILFIEHGESIGAKRLKDIKELADKAGWQIILEQVERGTENLKIEIMAG